jgi:hypothetical protein
VSVGRGQSDGDGRSMWVSKVKTWHLEHTPIVRVLYHAFVPLFFLCCSVLDSSTMFRDLNRPTFVKTHTMGEVPRGHVQRQRIRTLQRVGITCAYARDNRRSQP